MDEQYVSVYGLTDPRDELIFYIGVSVDPYIRYGQHIALIGHSPNPAKTQRILNMKGEGLFPGLVIIEDKIPEKEGSEREWYWISHYLSFGMPLVNKLKVKSTKPKPKPKSKPKPFISTPVTALPKGKGRWINSQQAADILTKRHGRKISDAYVRRLVGMGKITVKAESERKKLYWEEDVQTCEIKKQGDGSVRRAVRGKKG